MDGRALGVEADIVAGVMPEVVGITDQVVQLLSLIHISEPTRPY